MKVSGGTSHCELPPFSVEGKLTSFGPATSTLKYLALLISGIALIPCTGSATSLWVSYQEGGNEGGSEGEREGREGRRGGREGGKGKERGGGREWEKSQFPASNKPHFL